MSVRVLQICHSAHPPFADIAGTYHQAALGAGWQLHTVFLCGPMPATLPSARSLQLATGQLAGLKLIAWRRLSALLEPPYDLVIAHRYKPLYLALLARPGPIVGVAHEFGMLERGGRRALLGALGADVRLAGVSVPVAQQLAGRVGRDRVRVLPNVLDLEALRAALLPRDQARARLGVTADAVLVGHVGRLHRKKHLDVLLDAFATIRGVQGAEARLLLIGDGPERSALGVQAQRLGLADTVQFAGHVPQARQLLPALDLLVVSSGPQEAFGMTVLEGVAAGVPVLTADAGGPPTLFEGELPTFASGDAASLADAMLRCLRTPPASPTRRLEREYSVAALTRRLQSLLA